MTAWVQFYFYTGESTVASQLVVIMVIDCQYLVFAINYMVAHGYFFII